MQINVNPIEKRHISVTDWFLNIPITLVVTLQYIPRESNKEGFLFTFVGRGC